MSIVVALGSIDTSIVSAELGTGVTLVTDPSPADLHVAVGAIVRAHIDLDAAAIDAMPALRVIARTGVGTERVDVRHAHSKGIPVIITPGSNSRAVAEGALAMMLTLVKSLPQLHAIVDENRWADRESITVGDIDGSTVGIIGYGRIGRRLAELVTALGARVIAFDPGTTVPDLMAVDSVDELLRQSDIVSLHVPLVDSTRHLINSRTLSLVKHGALLVNCGRGPLVDLDAVNVALNSGSLGGFATDVFDDEPPAPHSVFAHPRTLLSPHVMGLSTRAAAETFRMAAQGIRDVLDGTTPHNIAGIS